MEEIQLVWTVESSVGSSEVDAHNRRILDLINKLGRAKGQEKSSEVASEVMSELVKRTSLHLDKEEALLRLLQFSDLENHILHHQAFRREIANLTREALTSDPLFQQDLLDILVSWWRNHILVEDRKYRELVLQAKKCW